MVTLTQEALNNALKGEWYTEFLLKLQSTGGNRINEDSETFEDLCNEHYIRLYEGVENGEYKIDSLEAEEVIGFIKRGIRQHCRSHKRRRKSTPIMIPLDTVYNIGKIDSYDVSDSMLEVLTDEEKVWFLSYYANGCELKATAKAVCIPRTSFRRLLNPVLEKVVKYVQYNITAEELLGLRKEIPQCHE